MKFKKVLDEVNFTIDSILIFESIISSAAIFLVFYLVLMLVNLDRILAVIPAVAYLIYAILMNLKTSKVKKVEEKFPELNEKFRTIADNYNIDNPVVEELCKEVLRDLKKVTMSSFFRVSRTTLKLFGIMVLCFLIVLFSAIDFQLFDFNVVIEEDKSTLRIGDGSANGTTDESTASSGSGLDDIYGDESIADIGNEQINLEITSLSFELSDIRSEDDIPDDDFEETFPDSVSMLRACDDPPCNLEDKIPVENQELVKSYFIKLSEVEE